MRVTHPSMEQLETPGIGGRTVMMLMLVHQISLPGDTRKASEHTWIAKLELFILGTEIGASLFA